MTRGSLRPPRPGSRIARMAWRLAAVLFVCTSENIWLDPWLRNKSHRVPSLVPEALGGIWFLVFVMGSVVLTLLVMCQILLARDRNTRFATKLGTGVVLLIVLSLSVEWVRVTNRQPSIFRLETWTKKHTVAVKWDASSSRVAGYNVYRSTTPGGAYVKLNPSIIQGLSYTDETVRNGVTYYYVARAVDSEGRESINSNEGAAAVP